MADTAEPTGPPETVANPEAPKTKKRKAPCGVREGPCQAPPAAGPGGHQPARCQAAEPARARQVAGRGRDAACRGVPEGAGVSEAGPGSKLFEAEIVSSVFMSLRAYIKWDWGAQARIGDVRYLQRGGHAVLH